MSKRAFSLFLLFHLFGFSLFPLISLAHYQIDPFIYRSEYRGPKEGNQETKLKEYIQMDAKYNPYYVPGIDPTSQQEKEDPLSFGMMNVYTQLYWNLFMDSLPNTISRIYADLNGFRVEKIKREYIVHGPTPKEIPPYLAQVMQKTARLQFRFGPLPMTLGEQINVTLYRLHYNMMKKGRYGLAKGSYRKIGLRDSGYFEKTQSYSKGTKYSLTFKEAMIREAKTAFIESFMPWSQHAKSSQWVKMTGYVGLGATFFFTFLDYGWGENAQHGWFSTEFAAALVTDVAFGGLISVLGSVVGAISVMVLVTFTTLTFNLIAVGFVIVTVTFFIGMAFESVPVIKRFKDYCHSKINQLIEFTVKKVKESVSAATEAVVSFFKKLGF